MFTHSWSVFFKAISGSLSPPTLWISDWNLASLHRQEDGQWTLCYFSKCQSSLCMLALSNQMRITRLICLSTSSSPHLVVKLIANSGDVSLNQHYSRVWLCFSNLAPILLELTRSQWNWILILIKDCEAQYWGHNFETLPINGGEVVDTMAHLLDL